jgi:protein-disulfide isomerase
VTAAPPETVSPPAPTGRRSHQLLVPTFVLVAALLLGMAALGSGGTGDAPTGGDATTTAAASEADAAGTDLTSFERRDPDDRLALGSPDAPVVLVEWADWQCRFCGVFARQVEPELVERHVAAGTLRIEWRDLPILGQESLTAALGGRAAAEQDAFWAYHEAVFAEDRGIDSGQLTAEALVELAGELGLDTERFARDLDDPALLAAVQRDHAEGQQLGITSTPAFLVGGQPLLGAQPVEVFDAAIEQALADAGA